MLYIDPVLGGSAEFGDLRDSILNIEVSGDARSTTITHNTTSAPASVPVSSAPVNVPWWLIVFGVFAFMALSDK
jgi:hypothetical protein